METKKCWRCQEHKPLSTEFFGKHNSTSDGFRSECKKCRNQKLVHHWQDGKLRCSTCKIYHDPSYFDSNTSKAHRDYKDGVCKSCKSMAAKNRKMQRYTADPLRRMLVERVAGAKDRCKRSNVFIDITLDDLFYLWDRQDGKCAISRIPMTYTM